MKWWLAIPLTIALIAISSLLTEAWNLPFAWIMIISTSSWAAFDSSKIKLVQFKSALSYKPITLFLALCFLWVIGFPWYLVVRHRIKSGNAVLRPDPNLHTGILSRGI